MKWEKPLVNFSFFWSDFHTRILDDTIRHFHDTPYRYEKFLDVIKLDRCNRVQECQEEIAFMHQHSVFLLTLPRSWKRKIIPHRVTHNDTKLSNVLLDEKTGKAL